MVEVRAAVDGDVPPIAQVWRSGWTDGHLGNVPDELVAARTGESFGPRAAERVDGTMVAVVDGEIAGFVMVVDDEVEQVYVAAEHRGTSVATTLLAEAERRVAAGGHDKVWLAVVAGNARARRFYERNGWIDHGPMDYVADGGIKVPVRRYIKQITEDPARKKEPDLPLSEQCD